MPSYSELNPRNPYGQTWHADETGRQRTVSRLLALRDGLANGEGAPPSKSFDSLLIGTWNIREFDSTTWGIRLPETFFYIAEIIDRFDIVAVQEVRSDLTALRALKQRLGPNWNYLVSDITEGGPGNGERLAFLYDERKVRFLGIAGELVIPPIESEGKRVPSEQVARTPLMAAFQVGWTKFVLSTVHIVYGEATAEPAARVEEIAQVAEFLRERSDEPTEPVRNYILLGDFNIFSENDSTMKALLDAGFSLPEGISSVPGSNVPRNKKYDQIAFRSRQDRFEATGRAGVFDYYQFLMTEQDEPVYRPYIDAYIKQRKDGGKDSPRSPATAEAALAQFKMWRTYQLSDHLPLWAEFKIDFASDYLTRVL